MDQPPMDDVDSNPDPGVSSGSRTARQLRDSFAPDEQERIETAVSELLDTLGKTHAMAVLREFAFADGPLRYSDLADAIDASPSTLSARLRDLTAAGLLDRTAYDEVPPRVEYEPTPRAVSLFPVFGHLHRWAITYATDVEPPEPVPDRRSSGDSYLDEADPESRQP